MMFSFKVDASETKSKESLTSRSLFCEREIFGLHQDKETMTELLHMNDSYLREFDALVVDQGYMAVHLDRTVFFPGGGGQPPDIGWLSWPSSETRVIGMKEEGGVLWHVLEGPVPALGQPVHGILDWERRYAIMRYHSALHVLVGTVYQLYGASVTGVAIYPDRARMDFSLEDLSKERVATIEAEANRVIQEDRHIMVRWISREEFEQANLVRLARNLVPKDIQRIRVIEIEDFDSQADSGTHVHSTYEIGRLVITKTDNKGKINRRMEIKVT
jgi:Ser-tRNA(Ala) deacylase AlaX